MNIRAKDILSDIYHSYDKFKQSYILVATSRSPIFRILRYMLRKNLLDL